MNTVITQSLATGLPVVATRHSGFPEQVIEGKNGYLGEENNPESIADAILKYMEHPELWKDMSTASREHVLLNYDQKVLIDKQLEYYKKICQ